MQKSLSFNEDYLICLGECRSLPLQEIGKRKRGAKVASISSSAVKPQQLEVEMKRSTFDAEEFALYRKYQVRVMGTHCKL